jgi:Restriction endonuclease
MSRSEDKIDTHPCPESGKLIRLPMFQNAADKNGVIHFTEDDCHELIGKVCTASCNYPFLIPWQLEMLQWLGNEFGFSEFSKTTEELNGFNKTVQTVTSRGLIVSEDRTAAIWHSALPDEALPKVLVEMRERRIPVSHIFKGEEYLLVRCGSTVMAFNLAKFNLLEQFINSMDNYTQTPLESIAINPDTRGLTIKARWIWLGLAGLRGEGYDEEERIRLSSRLEASRPFFEFKAPIQIDWRLLQEPQDENFQELCRLLMERLPNVTKVVSIGKARAADRGRDFELEETTQGLVGSTTMRWLVQCKYSKRSVSPDTIKDWTDRVREHGYNGFWLMTNNDLTPDLFDQFSGVESNTDIKVKFWQRLDFHRKLNVYSELLTSGQFFRKS